VANIYRLDDFIFTIGLYTVSVFSDYGIRTATLGSRIIVYLELLIITVRCSIRAAHRACGCSTYRWRSGNDLIALYLYYASRADAILQKRFSISEMAADRHELMIPQRVMRPSVANTSEQLDSYYAYITGLARSSVCLSLCMSRTGF